jgi:hypothetical protein
MGLRWLKVETGSPAAGGARVVREGRICALRPFGAYPLGDPWSIFMEKALF